MVKLDKKTYTIFIIIIIVFVILFTPLIGNWRHSSLESEIGQSSYPLTFPKDMLWGTATASQQSEHQANSDWSAFENRAFKEGLSKHSKNPGEGVAGHIAGIDSWPVDIIRKKADFNRQYPEDFKKMKEMGLNSFRFSFSWSRLFPGANMEKPDPAAILYYKNLLSELKKVGLEPSATLFHFSSPEWFWQEKNGKKGWERDDAVALFSQYTKAVIENFGMDINFWCTLNEPMVYIYNGYMTGMFPPLEKRDNPGELLVVIENILRAHADSYKLLHAFAAKNNLPYLVGITKHTRAFEPMNRYSIFDRLTAAGVEQAFIWDFQDAMATGVLKISGTDIDKKIAGLKGSYDYTGINYYGRFYVSGNLSNPTKPVISMHDKSVSEPKNDLGWALYPAGFYSIMKKTYSKYKKPIYILENGTADKNQNDKIRQYLLISHLREISKAVIDGIPVKGYYHWTFTDNFEWAEGFEAKFGLYAVDYKNNFKRTPRKSASMFSKIINKGITATHWDEWAEDK